MELAASGEGNPVRGLDFEKSFAADGKIKLVAGLHGSPLFMVGGQSDGFANPLPVFVGGVKHLPEGEVFPFIAGGVYIGQVVGDLIQALALGQHGFRTFDETEPVLDEHGDFLWFC